MRPPDNAMQIGTATTGSLSVGGCASLACTLEVTAPKAGNVFPGAEFSDLGVVDFLAAAAVCGQVFEDAANRSLGDLVLSCIEHTMRIARTNVHLGIVLLLAPLAKAAAKRRTETESSGNVDPRQLRREVASQLAVLDIDDGRKVFQAIRLASPGGLQESVEFDIHDTVDVDLMAAMETARHRDAIAEQYCTEFAYVFDTVVPWLAESIEREGDVLAGIGHAHMRLLAQRTDSLIARKCGEVIAEQCRQMAWETVQAGGTDPHSDAWRRFDAWCRNDGNRRNPGTSADLIASGLFVLLVTDRYFQWRHR